MSDMEKFFTRQKAQEGKKVPLCLPDGSPSEHWVVIRGVDSDAYREAMEAQRKLMVANTIEVDGKTVVDPAVFEGSADRLLAALVADWSFEEECNVESIIRFFKEAPQIRDDIDKLVTDRQYFFGGGENESKPSSKRKRSSPRKSPKNRA